MNDRPRIMLAAPYSGAGKTTVVMALLAALQARGLKPAAFKCGPDYIDPMFHRAVLGVPSFNLDLFLSAEDTVRGLLHQHAKGHDLAVIEGVMGYYDGVGGTHRAGSYDLARATQTPVLLVLPARGAALSLAALARGFAGFRQPSHVAGIILNDCSEALYAKLKPVLEAESGLPLYGYLPRLADCTIESRHLGLVTAAEIVNLRQKISKLGDAARQSLDVEALLKLAHSAPPLSGELPEIKPVTNKKPRIAVAYDEAFCFYYADNLALLRLLGAELIMFSPLRDASLPEHTQALYVGGGYPELYAKELSQNFPMRQSLREAVRRGLPTLAECGGFLYLQQSLDGQPMAGALPGQAFATKQLQRFGYLTLTARRDNLLCPAGASIPAHEFHYWESSAIGEDCTALKPDGRCWPSVVANDTLFAGFPHLYFYGNIDFAARFVAKAAAYGGV